MVGTELGPGPGAPRSRRPPWYRVGPAIVAAGLVSACRDSPSALDPKGPAAETIADLWWFMFVLAALVFAAVVGLLLYALFRPRRDQGAGLADSRLFVPVTGVVIPAVILIVLFGVALGAMRALAVPPRREALLVEVIGYQWWWEVRYPDQGVVTANEIQVPVGRPVRLRLLSADVIHSFWVPELNGKMDLVPGEPNTFFFEAARPGVYRGLCAEFCGVQHAKMQLRVVAQPPEQFAAWIEQQQPPAVETLEPLARRGQQVFMASQCPACHTIRGTPADGQAGPDLTHIASRQTLAAGILENNRGNLGGWIVNPQRLKRGNKMPPTDLTGEELQALLTYLQSLE